MLTIVQLKKRRNEWLSDGITYSTIDAQDCMVTVSIVYPSDQGRAKWGYAWCFLDSPYGIPRAGGHLFDTAEDVMQWADRLFVEHFEWFDGERAA